MALIAIDAEIGSDPRRQLRRQIVRAILLEIACASSPIGWRALSEAPWWLVDGTVEILRRRDSGVDTELFRRLVENNKLPAIEQFLTLRSGDLGRTAEANDARLRHGACQLLKLPNGRSDLDG
jgi:hypothetical protein